MYPFDVHGHKHKPVIRAHKMLFTCNVPKYHPWIWQKMQQILDVDRNVPREKRHRIVYLPRGGNNRRVENEDELLKELRAWIDQYNQMMMMERYNNISKQQQQQQQIDNNTDTLRPQQQQQHLHKEFKPLTLDLFISNKESFASLRKFFNQETRAVIGPHGGALYNINFCPSDTLVIEFFPYVKQKTKDNKIQLTGVRHPTGFWWQAAALGQDYWMLPIPATNDSGNMKVVVADVLAILTKRFALE